MDKLKLGFVGAGNMAGAIMDGILGRGLLQAREIGVYDISADKLREREEKGFRAFGDIPSLVAGCGTVILAIKPQNFAEALPQVRQGIAPETVLVSIAAGIPAQRIQSAMGFPCKLVLAMPNTPLLLGEGATALCRVEPATAEEFAFVRSLFEAAGTAREVEPHLMSEIIPVNGSAPAFIYLLAKSIVDRAERAGIDRDTANALFCQTLAGSAKMMTESGKSHQELIDMVCSPGGTTIAAMDALYDNGFVEAVNGCFDACVRRAKELAG